MFTDITSPVIITEENDPHIYKRSDTTTSEIPIEYPFELLNGENLVEHGQDLTDGCIYLTNYRLFISFNQSSMYHYSFINCILGLIELIELKDNIYLYIQCKEFRTFRLIFSLSDKCLYWFKKCQETLLLLTNIEHIFALKYQYQILNEKHNYFHHDIIRLKLNQTPWRIIELNKDYKLSSTYPNCCVVPERITDDDIRIIAKFRSHARFPTIVWKHRNGAVIARCSQPEVGWLFWRSKEDEKMMEEIINACQLSTNQLNSLPKRLLIVDARSYAAALANRAKGGGFEHPTYYNNCDVQFMNLPNIHVVRKSAQMLRLAITNVTQNEYWLSQLESSRWLHYLSALINAAQCVVVQVDQKAQPVLIHCSDGWDRTPQLTSLAKIMLDSYYRTIEGFQVLIQCEWIGFGHKFADRCGHANGSTDLNERSPVFLQWIDCVYQLFSQYPTAFEFNEMFLLKLAYHTYSCLFGTFLCNTDNDRTTECLDTKTSSIWSLLNRNSKQFVNHLFDKNKTEILYPSSSVRDLIIWSNLYLRDIRYTSASRPEQSTNNIPVRIRSYDDLSTSITNTLHRSISDSNLPHLSNHDSSILATSIRLNSNISTQQQTQFNRLQSSPSTNSLMSSPNQLNLVNEHTNQNCLHTPSTPDNHLKHETYPIDDLSSPDIIQLASSIQRFQLNIHSVDSILRIQTKARRHTNSLSSTTSSLSEAWSLPRINSYDQTQRMIQHIPSNRTIKSIRKRIDIDGLTKLPDRITSRMLQKERNYQQQIQNLHDNIHRMQRLVSALININNNQNTSPHTDSISQNSMSSIGTSSCASWQKIDDIDAHVTRWIPDFNVQSCHSCRTKFQQWPFSRKHHCRKCGNVCCYNCTNNYIVIPSLDLTTPVRVCRDCLPNTIDDNNNNNNNNTTSPVTIPSGTCRQSNNSFPSPGGQKVKG